MVPARRRVTAKPFGSLVAHVPVTVAALLIAVCITGAKLYSSSAASAAFAEQSAETCRSDSALILTIPSTPASAERTVAEIGSHLQHTEPPIRGAIAKPILARSASAPVRLTLVYRDGIEQQVSPALQPLGKNEIAVSRSNLIQLQAEVGDTVRLSGGPPLTITQVFDDVPYQPLPEFWCGYPELLEPTSGGDLPPPSAIASFETVSSFGVEARAVVFDEHQISREPLTLSEAGEMERSVQQAAREWNHSFPEQREVPHNEMANVVNRARAVRTTVERNLAPVLLTGLVADLVVLLAAGVLVARERRRELRLHAVRGLHPARIGLIVAPSLVRSVLLGSVLGFGIAWGGVALAGPSSLLEPGAIIGAALLLAAAAVFASLAVTAVVALVADSYADPRRARVGTRVPLAVIAAAAVALAVVAFRRLDANGGVRTSGVRSDGGDLLAMGFPLFTMLAVVICAALVLAAVAPLLRLTGGRLGRALRLGWRRAVLEGGPLAAIVGSVALAAGCFTIAVALSSGAQRQLDEKAQVYVGSDLAVTVFDPVDVPAEWRDRTTMTTRIRGKVDGTPVDVVGVDPATFASVATLRGDASSKSLPELLALLGTGGPGIQAIAVGGTAVTGDDATVVPRGGADPVELTVATTVDFFPTKKSGVPMFVVSKADLDEAVQFSTSILLVRDPPADALAAIQAAGARTGLVLNVDSAFDGSAYSALRWAYVPLAALGVLFAVVALALQLLVVSARRDQRRIAHAMMVRTGFRRRAAWIAAATETGVPLVAGAVVGMAAAVGAARLAVPRLDPMPLLDPIARFVMPWSVLAGAAVVGVVWTAVIATAIVRSTERGDPMQVFHGAP